MDTWDGIGQKDDDYMLADLTLDAERLRYNMSAQPRTGANGNGHGLNPDEEEDEMIEHGEDILNFTGLRDVLVENFQFLHKHKLIAWLKPAREIRPRDGVDRVEFIPRDR